MNIAHLPCLLTCIPLLASSIVFAENTIDKDAIYHYQQGWRAADRITPETGLSENQIEEALKGFEARLRNQPSAYTPDDIRQAVEHKREQQSIARQELGEQNLEAGEQFMASLASDPRYSFLNRGLAFKINTTGHGATPIATSQVQIQYTGRHLDGTIFDQKVDPVWVPLQGVLPGWRIALLQMSAGSHWTLFIPPHLAYGEQGAGNRITPHETLIYEIKLLNIR